MGRLCIFLWLSCWKYFHRYSSILFFSLIFFEFFEFFEAPERKPIFSAFYRSNVKSGPTGGHRTDDPGDTFEGGAGVVVGANNQKVIYLLHFFFINTLKMLKDLYDKMVAARAANYTTTKINQEASALINQVVQKKAFYPLVASNWVSQKTQVVDGNNWYMYSLAK